MRRVVITGVGAVSVLGDTREEIARAVIAKLKEKDEVNMIFAAAPSQDEMLKRLVAYEGIDWTRVNAFHMDEYVGLGPDAPAGFGNFLRQRVFGKLPFKSVNYLDGLAADPEEECRRYSLKESDFVLNERLSVKTYEFEIHYLND